MCKTDPIELYQTMVQNTNPPEDAENEVAVEADVYEVLFQDDDFNNYSDVEFSDGDEGEAENESEHGLSWMALNDDENEGLSNDWYDIEEEDYDDDVEDDDFDDLWCDINKDDDEGSNADSEDNNWELQSEGGNDSNSWTTDSNQDDCNSDSYYDGEESETSSANLTVKISNIISKENASDYYTESTSDDFDNYDSTDSENVYTKECVSSEDNNRYSDSETDTNEMRYISCEEIECNFNRCNIATNTTEEDFEGIKCPNSTNLALETVESVADQDKDAYSQRGCGKRMKKN